MPSDNTINLKTYVDQRIDDIDRRINDRFTLAAEALRIADTAMTRRLETMNEIRGTLVDQSARMATRVELEALKEIINEIRRQRENTSGRLAVVTGAVLIVPAIISMIMQYLFRP